ncbi:MAG: hypothetical protein F4X40_03275 [Chloroflexi bacterium]|nr:hypothetical protein [Chloroflexota bacterium]
MSTTGAVVWILSESIHDAAETVRLELSQNLTAVRGELSSNISAVRGDLSESIGQVRTSVIENGYAIANIRGQLESSVTTFPSEGGGFSPATLTDNGSDSMIWFPNEWYFSEDLLPKWSCTRTDNQLICDMGPVSGTPTEDPEDR